MDGKAKMRPETPIEMAVRILGLVPYEDPRKKYLPTGDDETDEAPRDDSDPLALDLGPRPLTPEEELAVLRADLGECERCELCKSRKKIVWGNGSARARLVVIGEAPGGDEDEQGEPFVGRAGEMLDKMLSKVIGIEREQVFVLNTLKCRPPRNRDPDPAELERCLPFARRQVDIINPDIILALGSVASKGFLRTPHGATRSRGRWYPYTLGSGRVVPAMVTFHPAYLLRKPIDKRLTVDDLNEVVRVMKGGEVHFS